MKPTQELLGSRRAWGRMCTERLFIILFKRSVHTRWCVCVYGTKYGHDPRQLRAPESAAPLLLASLLPAALWDLPRRNIFSTPRAAAYRASEKYYKLTLIYNPRRRAQEFLGRFQKRPTREGASPSSWSETTNSDYLSRDEIGSVALFYLRALRRCS